MSLNSSYVTEETESGNEFLATMDADHDVMMETDPDIDPKVLQRPSVISVRAPASFINLEESNAGGAQPINDCNVITVLVLKDCFVRIERLNLETQTIGPCKQQSPAGLVEESTTGECKSGTKYEKRKFICDYCGAILAHKSSLVKHMYRFMHIERSTRQESSHGTQKGKKVSNRNTIFPCQICKKIFTQGSNLKKHQRLCKMHWCNMCGKEIANSDYEMHKRFHSKETLFKCEICEKGFTTMRSLKLHLMIHVGEKSYQCEICKRNFVHAANLKRHKFIHKRDKRYSCGSCKRKFNHLSSLKSHVTWVHGVNHQTSDLIKKYKIPEKKQHLCKFCKKEFKNASTLRYHERLHTGEKPYLCTICKKWFRLNTNLHKHNDRNHKVYDSKRKVFNNNAKNL